MEFDNLCHGREETMDCDCNCRHCELFAQYMRSQ